MVEIGSLETAILSTLSFSILQRVSSDMETAEDIVRLEGTWKEWLHTRQPHGLNDNGSGGKRFALPLLAQSHGLSCMYSMSNLSATADG